MSLTTSANDGRGTLAKTLEATKMLMTFPLGAIWPCCVAVGCSPRGDSHLLSHQPSSVLTSWSALRRRWEDGEGARRANAACVSDFRQIYLVICKFGGGRRRHRFLFVIWGVSTKYALSIKAKINCPSAAACAVMLCEINFLSHRPRGPVDNKTRHYISIFV